MKGLTNHILSSPLDDQEAVSGLVVFETISDAMGEMELLRARVLQLTGGFVWEGWCTSCPDQSHAIQSFEGAAICNACGEPIVLTKKHEQVMMH